jgi:hypothetical protein
MSFENNNEKAKLFSQYNKIEKGVNLRTILNYLYLTLFKRILNYNKQSR